MKKRFVALAMSSLMAVSLFASCGGGEAMDSSNGGVEVDASKTQLYVGNYYGGLGKEWLEKTAKKFEEAYADYELNGKKGVQIVTDNNKDKLDGSNLLSTIASSSNEVFFTEKVMVNEYLDQNLMLDITDVVTADLGVFSSAEAGTTIEDKVNENVKSYVTRDGKYYALPFYEGYYGFIYDVDLFTEKGLYFVDGYEEETVLEDKFVAGANDTKSAGRDGEYGTMDDGLPVTYDDFYDLCNYMKYGNGITPIVYPGTYPHYFTRAAFNLWATNEGAEQMALNFTLEGTATSLVDVSGTTVTAREATEITEDNKALLQKQAGKYYALEFLNTLANSSEWFSTSSGASKHTDAQFSFIVGSIDTSFEDIGIIVDGNWIESEATAYYTQAQTTKSARNIAIMPMPVAEEMKDNSDKATYVSTNNSFCFINAKCAQDKQELAKAFLLYCHTEEALQIFHSTTGVPRPYSFSYDVNSDLYKNLTTFQKSTYEIHNMTDFVFPYSGKSAYLSNSSTLKLDNWGFTSTVSTTYENPFNAFKDNSKLTTAQYFNGLYTKHSK